MKIQFAIAIVFGFAALITSCKKDDSGTGTVTPTPPSTTVTSPPSSTTTAPTAITLTLNDSLRTKLSVVTGYDVRDAATQDVLLSGGNSKYLTKAQVDSVKACTFVLIPKFTVNYPGKKQWYDPKPRGGIYYTVTYKVNTYIRLDWYRASNFIIKYDASGEIYTAGGTPDIGLYYGKNFE